MDARPGDTITPTERPYGICIPPGAGRSPRTGSDAIGDAAADAAYAEGRALPRDRAIEAFFAIQIEAAITYQTDPADWPRVLL